MNQKRRNIFIYLIIPFVIVVAVIRVVVFNLDSTQGEQLVYLTGKIEELKSENERLTQRLASSSALMALTTKAQAYGYVSINYLTSLTSPLPLALLDRSLR